MDLSFVDIRLELQDTVNTQLYLHGSNPVSAPHAFQLGLLLTSGWVYWQVEAPSMLL